jgi:hypothetical protein
VIDAGAVIKVLDRSYIDLTTPMGRGFMAMMSAMGFFLRLIYDEARPLISQGQATSASAALNAATCVRPRLPNVHADFYRRGISAY